MCMGSSSPSIDFVVCVAVEMLDHASSNSVARCACLDHYIFMIVWLYNPVFGLDQPGQWYQGCPWDTYVHTLTS